MSVVAYQQDGILLLFDGYLSSLISRFSVLFQLFSDLNLFVFTT